MSFSAAFHYRCFGIGNKWEWEYVYFVGVVGILGDMGMHKEITKLCIHRLIDRNHIFPACSWYHKFETLPKFRPWTVDICHRFIPLHIKQCSIQIQSVERSTFT
jgi:hypothetical protein